MAPVESMPPVPWATAMRASGTWVAPPSPRSWRTASTMRNMPRIPGDRPRGRRRRCWWGAARPPEPAVLDEGTALALGAEAEVLDGEHHGDGEGVVELGHVDVGRA